MCKSGFQALGTLSEILFACIWVCFANTNAFGTLSSYVSVFFNSSNSISKGEVIISFLQVENTGMEIVRGGNIFPQEENDS